jgi:hypothetical protein
MKCRKDRAPIGVIATVEKCIAGVQMSWEMFLLNQFLIYYREDQDKGMEFHYSWLLILIILVSWRDPYDTQFMGVVKKPCLAVKYVNKWHTADKERQLDNNIVFYVYKEVIQMSIQNTPRILP